MQEDIRKNFILLSKVAKEKKYAQEYLGLLARRGDIGSIRIGKRWYTTWQWFEEFLENSQKKSSFAKASAVADPRYAESSGEVRAMEGKMTERPAEKKEVVSQVQVAKAEPVEIKRAAPVEEAEISAAEHIAKIPARSEAKKSEEKIKITFSPAAIKEEEAAFAPPKVEKISIVENIPSQIRITQPQKSSSVPAEKTVGIKSINLRLREVRNAPKRTSAPGFQKVPQAFRGNAASNMRRNIRPLEIKKDPPREISVAERNRHAIPYPEIKLKQNAGVFSPDFSKEEKVRASLFPRFAFSMSFTAILLLVAASGYFAWSGGLFAKGQVAGVSDERSGGFRGIQSEGEDVLASAVDKIGEAMSISEVVLAAVQEKSSANEPAGVIAEPASSTVVSPANSQTSVQPAAAPKTSGNSKKKK
ncbi:MAG TPA: hypothetical protein VK254_03350 [Candidatus Bathyarchaeia archaeon]|nr:hypothetical protein [Candidatus Bathyarchaeia archaeon]